MTHFNHEDEDDTRWAEKGMASMWVEARKTQSRVRATPTGMAVACYPSASGAILWRANGYNYSRKELLSTLAFRRRKGLE